MFHPGKSLLTLLYRTEFITRTVFPYKLSTWLFFIGLTVFVIQYVDATYYDFLPPNWSPVLSQIIVPILISSPIILFINRLLYAFEHIFVRLYLKYLSPEEKGLLLQFVEEDRMIDVPLDYRSKHLHQLVNIGIISQGSGLTYPKSELHPGPHAYYAMPTWIFNYLKGNTAVLEM